MPHIRNATGWSRLFRSRAGLSQQSHVLNLGHKTVIPGEASKDLAPGPGRHSAPYARASELGVKIESDGNAPELSWYPQSKCMLGSIEPPPCPTCRCLMFVSHCAKIHVNSMPPRPVHGRSPSVQPFKLTFQGCRLQHDKPSRIAETR